MASSLTFLAAKFARRTATPPLLRRAGRIHALTEPPDARDNCRDCAAPAGLVAALGDTPRTGAGL